jgi:hypothetical protein
MLKRKPTEPIQPFRTRTARDEAGSLVALLAGALAAQPPGFEADLPAELADRAAEAWEPLFAIADAAGGAWPARARRAAIVLHASREQDDSLGLRLLSDIRIVFDQRCVPRIFTADLISALQADEEGPWASERVPLTPHHLGYLLKPFEIASKQVRIGAKSLKGYERHWFIDTWERYLPGVPSPSDPKQGNGEPERSFGVSDRDPSDGAVSPDSADLSAEEAYPGSGLGPKADESDPEADEWLAAPVPVPNAGEAV